MSGRPIRHVVSVISALSIEERMVTQTMNSVFWIAWILTAAFMEILKTTATKTTIQACINGVLTLSCKAVKNTDTDYEVQWKIQFPGTDADGWMKFLYCRHASDVHCRVQISTLPEGLKVLSNPNGTMTLERSEWSAGHDHARIMCQVHGISDHSLASHHLYEVNFSARCVWIEQGRNLNLTKTLLMNEIQCAYVVDIEWYDENGNRFAYCNSCHRCKKTNNTRGNHPVPVFGNRVQIVGDSLLLTTIQDSDNKSKIIIKLHTKTPRSNMQEVPSDYTIQIFVHTADRGSPATSTVTTALVRSASRVTSQADLGTIRSSLPSPRASHPGNVSVTPSSVSSLHSKSLTKSGVSAITGQSWTTVLSAAVVFHYICLR